MLTGWRYCSSTRDPARRIRRVISSNQRNRCKLCDIPQACDVTETFALLVVPINLAPSIPVSPLLLPLAPSLFICSFLSVSGHLHLSAGSRAQLSSRVFYFCYLPLFWLPISLHVSPLPSAPLGLYSVPCWVYCSFPRSSSLCLTSRQVEQCWFHRCDNCLYVMRHWFFVNRRNCKVQCQPGRLAISTAPHGMF